MQIMGNPIKLAELSNSNNIGRFNPTSSIIEMSANFC